MKTETVLLTPELAADLLARNKMNRKVVQDHVDYLAGEMLAGRWIENGDPVAIDTDGVFANGQHRAHASIKAGYSFMVNLVTEVPPEARLTYDDPLRRRFSDDLTMNGRGPNTIVQESLLRRILIWNNQHGFARTGKGKIGRGELAQEYPKYRDAMLRAIAMIHRHSKAPVQGAVAAFIAWLLLDNAPEELVEHFFSVLAIGSQLPEDYQLVRLRDRIITVKAEPSMGWQGGGKSPYIIWLIIQGWNAWLTGKSSSLALPRGRKLTNPFPAPVMVASELVKGRSK
jgi:hypothetical protein